MVSTAVHRQDPASASTVRRLMLHTKKAAQVSYMRASLTSDAVAAHDAVMRNTTLTKTVADKEKNDKTTKTIKTTSPKRTSSLIPIECQEVKALFAEEIRSHSKVMTEAVRQMRRRSLTFVALATNSAIMKTIFDMVLYHQKVMAPATPPEDEQTMGKKEENWLLAETSSSIQSGFRVRWSPEDTDAIKKCSKFCRQKPIFQGNSPLSHFVDFIQLH